ncbi:HK97-gp10 family putative phage morphogenesis protein [Alicyclobacillus dauci]|uniref:HK97 gp10 family phage protein n=1 Tax=Alicyclobacillus dauci TaxID=1475485 RepID=A0ABY6Z7Q5_9BACL|nr:HK97-gp10 family putative phage morphogenesis protein [Alicyclobacillus dauci]WAH38617.1 HK97 gp10 family phage protein [Alicyclobacillus dauci]
MADLQLDGLDSLVSRLQSMGRVGSRIANNALKKAAEPLQQAMMDNVNLSKYNDIHLRDDIEISRVKTDSSGQRYVEVGPGKQTAWRAKFLEFGTSKMTAHPFMDPALKDSKDKIMSIMASEIRSGLNT